jgi:hypothetical protein
MPPDAPAGRFESNRAYRIFLPKLLISLGFLSRPSGRGTNFWDEWRAACSAPRHPADFQFLHFSLQVSAHGSCLRADQGTADRRRPPSGRSRVRLRPLLFEVLLRTITSGTSRVGLIAGPGRQGSSGSGSVRRCAAARLARFVGSGMSRAGGSTASHGSPLGQVVAPDTLLLAFGCMQPSTAHLGQLRDAHHETLWPLVPLCVRPL